MKKIELNDNEVMDIVRILKETDYSYDYISAKYNITKNYITLINTGKKYEHLLSNENFPIRKTAVRKKKKDMIESKLTDAKIIEIIKLLKENEVKFEDIAKLYNVNRHIIGRINSGDFDSSFLEDVTFPVRTQHIRQKKGENSIKLSDNDILKIVKLLKGNKLTFKEIAEKFNVSIWTINRINGGHRCTDLLKNETFPIRAEQKRNSSIESIPNNAKLSEEDIANIISLLKNTNDSLRAIGRIYNVDSSVIVRINNGKAWSFVTSKYVKEYPIRTKK